MDYPFTDNSPMHHDENKSLSRALAQLMRQRPDLDTLQKVAAKAGIGYGTVRRARKGEGNITLNSMNALARAFGLDGSEALLRHDPDRRHDASAPVKKFTAADAAAENNRGLEGVFSNQPMPIGIYDVPLLTWEDIQMGLDSIHSGADARHVKSTVGGESICAVLMPDDSMTNASGQSIPAGATIFFDTDIDPAPGNVVIVRMPDNRCYVRKLVSDAGRWKLMPFNTRYDPSPAPDDRGAYIGVVVRSSVECEW